MAEALPEGAEVIVHLEEPGDDEFVLTPELRKELREAWESAARGELVDFDAVLDEADPGH